MDLVYATSCRYSRSQAQAIERKAKSRPRDLKLSFLEKADAEVGTET
ncbi:MAG: hypothetical protein PHE57_00460 [Synergistales bacterium]|nr:hypothetical protein [Synergistales bacterium]